MASHSIDLTDIDNAIAKVRRTKETINYRLNLAKEEGELTVETILQEIILQASDVVYLHYIQRKISPYVAEKAKTALFNIVEVSLILASELM